MNSELPQGTLGTGATALEDQAQLLDLSLYIQRDKKDTYFLCNLSFSTTIIM